MASVTEMQAKVAQGIQDVEEAVNLVLQVQEKADEVIGLWASVSDNEKLMDAINALGAGKELLDQFISLANLSTEHASTYIAGLAT